MWICLRLDWTYYCVTRNENIIVSKLTDRAFIQPVLTTVMRSVQHSLFNCGFYCVFHQTKEDWLIKWWINLSVCPYSLRASLFPVLIILWSGWRDGQISQNWSISVGEMCMYLTICVELAAGHFDLGLVQMDTLLSFTKIWAENDFHIFVSADLDLWPLTLKFAPLVALVHQDFSTKL